MPASHHWSLPAMPAVLDADNPADLREQAKRALVAWQQGRCAVCGKPLDEECLDHDHDTGRVRGVLCFSCNSLEGAGGGGPVFDRYRADPPAGRLALDVPYEIGPRHWITHTIADGPVPGTVLDAGDAWWDNHHETGLPNRRANVPKWTTVDQPSADRMVTWLRSAATDSGRRALGVMQHLVAHPGQVFTRDELLAIAGCPARSWPAVLSAASRASSDTHHPRPDEPIPWTRWNTKAAGSLYALRPRVAELLRSAGLLDES